MLILAFQIWDKYNSNSMHLKYVNLLFLFIWVLSLGFLICEVIIICLTISCVRMKSLYVKIFYHLWSAMWSRHRIILVVIGSVILFKVLKLLVLEMGSLNIMKKNNNILDEFFKCDHITVDKTHAQLILYNYWGHLWLLLYYSYLHVSLVRDSRVPHSTTAGSGFSLLTPFHTKK